MALKGAKLLLLSALLCSVMVIVPAIIPLARTGAATFVNPDSIANQYPSMIFTGDPVPGGGTPNGNHTGG